MTPQEMKRAAYFIDQIDPIPHHESRLTVAIIREAVEAVKAFYGVSEQFIPGKSFDGMKYFELSPSKKYELRHAVDEGRTAWIWLNGSRKKRFILSFWECMTHNGTRDPEDVMLRTVEMLESLAPQVHLNYLKGMENVN